MADDQFAAREQQFNNSMAGVVGNTVKSVIIADADGQKAYVERLKALCSLPNITFKEAVNILGQDKPLELGIDIPALVACNIEPLGVTEAELHMSMTTHASAMDDKDIEGKAALDGEGSIGWGPFKISAHVHAETSVHSDHKRSSDYSATTDMTVKVGRLQTPEALQKVVDGLAGFTQLGININAGIASKRAGIPLPGAAPADGGGDGGGDGASQ